MFLCLMIFDDDGEKPLLGKPLEGGLIFIFLFGDTVKELGLGYIKA